MSANISSTNIALQPSPSSYYELFKSDGHPPVVQALLYVRAFFCTIGILFNLSLVLATLRSKKLRSTCGMLILLDAICMIVFLSGFLLAPFALFFFGIHFIPLNLCFYSQAPALIFVAAAFVVMLQIGLERLSSIFFPIWSVKKSSRQFQCLFTIVNFASTFHLCYQAFYDTIIVGKGIGMVLCDLGSCYKKDGLYYPIASNRAIIVHIALIVVYAVIFIAVFINKKLGAESVAVNSNNFSRGILKSLGLIILIESLGWLPSASLKTWVQSLHLSPLMSMCYTICASFLSIISASSNAPILFSFSRLYRAAFKNLLCDFGLLKENSSIVRMAQQARQKIMTMNAWTNGGNGA